MYGVGRWFGRTLNWRNWATFHKTTSTKLTSHARGEVICKNLMRLEIYEILTFKAVSSKALGFKHCLCGNIKHLTLRNDDNIIKVTGGKMLINVLLFLNIPSAIFRFLTILGSEASASWSQCRLLEKGSCAFWQFWCGDFSVSFLSIQVTFIDLWWNTEPQNDLLHV